jgi:hypothetical protein
LLIRNSVYLLSIDPTSRPSTILTEPVYNFISIYDLWKSSKTKRTNLTNFSRGLKLCSSVPLPPLRSATDTDSLTFRHEFFFLLLPLRSHIPAGEYQPQGAHLHSQSRTGHGQRGGALLALSIAG